MEIKVNIVEAAALAVVVLYLGVFCKRKVKFLDRFCIPSPVVGGLIFSGLTLIGYCTNAYIFVIDTTLQKIFMLAFFTTVGYCASFKAVKRGSGDLIILIVLVSVLIFLQDVIAFAIAPMFDLHPLLALCTGSISMVGGHGTSIAWGPIIENVGVAGAYGVAIASATFGLVSGSLIGGPIGRRLIERNKLLDKQDIPEEEKVLIEAENSDKHLSKDIIHAVYQIALAMGIGSVLSSYLESLGILFPSYVGALVVAAILRNISDFSGKFKINFVEIDVIGQACLSIFLAMALMSLKLWELADLALPMLVMLFAQTALMVLFAYFVIFRFLKKNYDSAVITAGVCGFGMGATPNAMANMEALTQHYARPSYKAFLIVPIVGVMFADIINTAFITIFVNIFK